MASISSPPHSHLYNPAGQVLRKKLDDWWTTAWQRGIKHGWQLACRSCTTWNKWNKRWTSSCRIYRTSWPEKSDVLSTCLHCKRKCEVILLGDHFIGDQSLIDIISRLLFWSRCSTCQPRANLCQSITMVTSNMESYGVAHQNNEGWMYQRVQLGKGARAKEGFYYSNNLFGNGFEGIREAGGRAVGNQSPSG